MGEFGFGVNVCADKSLTQNKIQKSNRTNFIIFPANDTIVIKSNGAVQSPGAMNLVRTRIYYLAAIILHKNSLLAGVNMPLLCQLRKSEFDRLFLLGQIANRLLLSFLCYKLSFMKNSIREQFVALAKSNPELAAALHMQLQLEYQNLAKRIAALEYQQYVLEKQRQADFILPASTPASHPARDWPMQNKE